MNAIRGLIDLYKTQAELLWKWRPGRRALIKRLIVVFIVAWVSLLLTAAILPGLVISGAAALTLAVIAFALVNALIRPVILFVFASISVVAVIVATLVFQILAFYLVEWLVPGFDVDRIFTAFLGSIVFALFNTVLSAIFLAGSSDTFYGLLVAQLARRRADRVVSDIPGVVILQIDGLAHPILAHQIRAGRVPSSRSGSAAARCRSTSGPPSCRRRPRRARPASSTATTASSPRSVGGRRSGR